VVRTAYSHPIFDKFFAAIVSLLIEPRVRGRVNDQDPVLGQSLGDGLMKTVEFSGRQMLDDAAATTKSKVRIYCNSVALPRWKETRFEMLESAFLRQPLAISIEAAE